MTAREIKWAAGGFLGGFLLCYLLIGAFQTQPASPGLVTKAAPVTAWPPVQVALAPLPTNLQPPEVIIELPPRWEGPGVPRPSLLNPGYSLDLIDTRPQSLEKP